MRAWLFGIALGGCLWGCGGDDGATGEITFKLNGASHRVWGETLEEIHAVYATKAPAHSPDISEKATVIKRRYNDTQGFQIQFPGMDAGDHDLPIGNLQWKADGEEHFCIGQLTIATYPAVGKRMRGTFSGSCGDGFALELTEGRLDVERASDDYQLW